MAETYILSKGGSLPADYQVNDSPTISDDANQSRLDQEAARWRVASREGLKEISVGYSSRYSTKFSVDLGRLVASGGSGFVYEGLMHTEQAGNHPESVLVKLIPNGQAEAFDANIAFRRILKEYAVPEQLLTACQVSPKYKHLEKHILHPLYPGRVNTELGTAYFVVFNNQPGVTLNSLVEDLISSGSYLSPQDIGRILLPVADTLELAHTVKCIHRDVKPGNILLRTDGVVQLLDYGSVKPNDEAGLVTPKGILIGTFGFIPPEFFLENKLDWHTGTDRYGLGSVLYYGATGFVPYADFEKFREISSIPVTDKDPKVVEENKRRRQGQCYAFFTDIFERRIMPTSVAAARPDLARTRKGRALIELVDAALEQDVNDRATMPEISEGLYSLLPFSEQVKYTFSKKYPAYDETKIKERIEKLKDPSTRSAVGPAPLQRSETLAA